MEKNDIIRAAVNVGGLEVFNLAPQFLEDPTNHLDELQVIANSMARLDGSCFSANLDLCHRICEKFARALDVPKLPRGGAVLASILEYLTVCLNEITFARTIWLKLAKNRKHFIRRRFARLLRDNLTQVEAAELWDVFCEKGDYEILRNLVLADSSVRLPKGSIDEIEEMEGHGYLLSRVLAHEIYAGGIKSYKRFLKKYPVSTIYAAGFSGRSDLVPKLRLIANRNQVSAEEYKGAIWALARLGDKEGIFEIAASILR